MVLEARLQWAYRTFLVFIATLLVARVAWISDDALITLRTALNLSNGWGAGFNATEQVQAYTHPLWFLLILLAGSVTGQWLLTIFVLSIGACALTIALLVVVASNVSRATLIVGLLLLSNAFVDFSTSGLENPLAYLMAAILFTLSLTHVRPTVDRPTVHAFLSGLTVAAILLLRLDFALLIAPIVLLMMWRWRSSLSALAVFLGSLLAPLAIWFAWSYNTYASPFPNTLDAKTNSQIPRGELLYGGIRYLWISFLEDPVSLIILVGALLIAIAVGGLIQRYWAAGIGLYLTYVVWIGGDFMAGRLVAVPVLIGAFIVASTRTTPDASMLGSSLLTKVSPAFIALIAIALGLQTWGNQPTALTDPQTPRWDKDFRGGVADERGEYVQRGWALQDLFVLSGNIQSGDAARQTASLIRSWPPFTESVGLPSEVEVVCGGLGIAGISAGPTAHIIDKCGLSDSFIASIAFVPTGPMGWRPGHLEREIPDGYVDAVLNNDPAGLKSVADQERLSELWDRIR